MGIRALGKNPLETELKEALKGIGTPLRPLFLFTLLSFLFLSLLSTFLPFRDGCPSAFSSLPDDNVDFATFKSFYEKKFPSPQSQDKDARAAFKLLDADNNGTIPESELRQMLATVGDALTHQEVRKRKKRENRER